MATQFILMKSVLSNTEPVTMESLRVSLPAVPDWRGLGQYDLFVFSLQSNIKNEFPVGQKLCYINFYRSVEAVHYENLHFDRGKVA